MTPHARCSCFVLSCIVLLNSVLLAESFRILCIYPVPFHSHQYVFRALTEELARRGHELVILTPLPHEVPIKNVTEIDVQEMSYRMADEAINKVMENRKVPYLSATEFWTEYVYPEMFPMVEAQFSTKEMQALLKDKTQHFDLLLIEACIPLGLMATIPFDAPVILVSSLLGSQHNYQVMGAPVHPWLIPDYSIQKIYNLSFWDKIAALFTTIKLNYLHMQSQKLENQVIKNVFGPDAPGIQDLYKNVQMLFINSHPIWDNNRPVPPSIIYMGALNLKKPKPVPNNIREFLDNSANGVIYMSLGSKMLASNLPPHVIDIFFNVFAKLPYNILLKWNGDQTIKKPNNVRFEQWLPQNDLLHHPNVKAFITHGGLQSTDEAIAAKVPVIGLPLIVDQFYNCQKYLQHGIGLQLDIHDINEDGLEKAIISVAEEDSYRKNLESLLKIMDIQRTGGLEKAIFWAEFVAKEGAKGLASPLSQASFVHYHMFEMCLLCSFLILCLTLAICFVKLYNILIISSSTERRTNKLKKQ